MDECFVNDFTTSENEVDVKGLSVFFEGVCFALASILGLKNVIVCFLVSWVVLFKMR